MVSAEIVDCDAMDIIILHDCIKPADTNLRNVLKNENGWLVSLFIASAQWAIMQKNPLFPDG